MDEQIVFPSRERRTLRVVNITYTGERANVVHHITFYDMFRNEIVVSKEFPLIHYTCIPLNSASVVATTLRYGVVDSVDQLFAWWQETSPAPTNTSHLFVVEGGRPNWGPGMQDMKQFHLKQGIVKAYVGGDKMAMAMAVSEFLKHKQAKQRRLSIVRPVPPPQPMV